MRAHGLALGLCLAIAMVISAWMVANTIRYVKLSNDTITVKGYAEVGVTADTGVWRGKLVARGLNLEDAYRELELAVQRFLEFASSQGIEATLIELEPANSYINHPVVDGHTLTGQVESYTLERRFSYTSSDVARIGEIARASVDLLRLGVDMQSWSPEYYVSAIDDVKLELLSKATANAMERAERLAESSGVKVGRLRSASQGVFQITPPNSTDVSDYGMYDTRTIDKTAKAVVTATYAIR
mgnify:CR=1 FL=1